MFRAVVVGLAFNLAAASSERWTISWQEYSEKVHGAWLGQIIGTLLGFPFEGRVASSELVWIDRYSTTDRRSPLVVGCAPVDDDYYYELVALRAFEQYGLDLTLDQLGEQWKANSAGSWGSSRETRLALLRGIPASQAGQPRHNRWWWTIGPQFSADLYGVIAPGDPNLAARLASRYGHLNGHAEAVDGAVFVAGMVSLAFRETDPKKIVREAARLIHPSSPYRQCLDQMISLAERGISAREVFDAIEHRWRPEYPAVNNAVVNGCLVAASVWFGEGDFLKTLNLAYRAADFSDADCNAANAGAVVGAMLGSERLPRHLVEPLHDRIRGEELGDVRLTPPVDERISEIAQRTARLGWRMAAAHGATASNDRLEVPLQPVNTLPLERFELPDLVEYWNPGWKLEGAGFGGYPGTGCNRATFLEENVLATWPRNEVRGVVLRRVVELGLEPVLELEVGADPGCAWRLEAYANNTRIASELIVGERQWRYLRLPLHEFAGQQVELRLYQLTLLPGRVPGNAYWRRVSLR